jgi:sulfonate transport system permease protein
LHEDAPLQAAASAGASAAASAGASAATAAAAPAGTPTVASPLQTRPAPAAHPGRPPASFSPSLADRWLAARWSAWTAPLLVLLLWSAATALEWAPPQILVSPWQVALTAAELVQSGELTDHLSVSLYRLFAGFALGGAAGLAAGVLLGLSKPLRAYVEPTFNVLRQLPTVALIPLFILVLGIGESFKVFIVAKATFFIVALAAHDAIRNISARYFEVASVYRFSRWSVIRRVALPAIVPDVLTGVRIALSRSWMVLVGAELLAADSGLGQMMEMGRQMFRLDVVMVGVVLTGVIGFALDRSFRLIEQRLTRWKKG